MFRVVTEFVEKTTLVMWCDRHDCAQTAALALNPGTNVNEASGAFFKSLNELGWIVAMDRTFCAGHATELRHGKRLVVTASAIAAKN